MHFVMKKRLLASVFTLTIFVAPLFASAQSADFSAALKRMDAIIAEMNALRSEFATLAGKVGVSVPTPAVQGVTTTSVLGDDLRYGSTNDDIARVQRLLATDAEIYPYGVDSGFYGPKTQEAVRRFQSRFELDTVGIIGPSTKLLLEAFMALYPSEDYPADVLKKGWPTAPTTVTTVPTVAPVLSASAATLKSITVSEDDDEYVVRSYKVNGDRNRDLILYADEYDDLVAQIAKQLEVSVSEVEGLVDEDDFDFGGKKKDDDYDESDAEDAIDEADEAIDDARDEINDAEDDDKDVDEADEYLKDAKDEFRKAENALDDEDYEDAVKNAEDAIELAEKAIDAIGGGSSSDEVEEIRVRIYDDRATVQVKYEDDDDESFTIRETDEDDIVDEIADELNMDTDDVEDLVEFLYQS